MFLRAQPWHLPFDNEEDAAKAAADKAAADKAAADKAAAGDSEKKFDQNDMNTVVAAEKRKNQERQRQLASELESLRKEKNLTDTQRTDLEQRIEELQAQYMTKEERARQDADRKKKEYDSQLEVAVAERDAWQQKHSQLSIGTAITHAAVENDAVNVEQVAALLGPRTKLVEKLDEEGTPTGEFEPRVSFSDVDKDGKDIILELNVGEAVVRMRELPIHQNLFRTDKKTGLGSSGSAGKGKKVNLAQIAKNNPKEFRRLRKERIAAEGK